MSSLFYHYTRDKWFDDVSTQPKWKLKNPQSTPEINNPHIDDYSSIPSFYSRKLLTNNSLMILQ